MNWSKIFANDLVTFTESQLFRKYEGNIPKGTNIQDVVAAIKTLSAEQQLIQKHWGNRDDNVFNLVAIDNGYEVFQIDRGGKHWMKKHSSLEAAIFDKIDRIFNAMLYAAADSEINFKPP
jgi:hypothetical protein